MNKLIEIARYNLDALSKTASHEKTGFEAMPAGAPQGDPAAAQGGVPPEAAMMADGGGMPVDPMAAGAGPAVGLPPPAAAPVPPAASPPGGAGDPAYDMIVNAVRQVVQEMGIAGGGGGDGGGGKGGKDVDARMSALEGALAQVLEQLGLANPEQALAQSVQEAAGPAAASGMGMEAGMPAGGEGSEALPPAAGPMDPNASVALSEIGTPSAKIAAVYDRPLDESAGAYEIASAIQRLRSGK